MRDPYMGAGGGGQRKDTNYVKEGKEEWCSRESPEAGKRLTCLINSLLMGSDMVSKGKRKIKNNHSALARWLSWLDLVLVYQKVACSIPCQDTNLGFGFHPWSPVGRVPETAD